MILISPWSKKLRNGKENPKNYPYWNELVELIKVNRSNGTFNHVIQIGIEGEEDVGADEFLKNLSLDEILKLINECKTWISVDNFFQHLAENSEKRGIVLWAQSDPLIFGYEHNINLIKDRKYLRLNQFEKWDMIQYSKDGFVSPEEVLKYI